VSDIVLAYDPAQPPGSRLSAEAVAEIQLVAPDTVADGTIDTRKMADNAISTSKIQPGAVTSPKIATGGVLTANIGPKQVTTAKIADGAVHFAQAGAGIATAQDASNNDISIRLVPMTAIAYAALSSVDPNTLYLLS
jgi:DNA-binding transcriptional LysR family regulator